MRALRSPSEKYSPCAAPGLLGSTLDRRRRCQPARLVIVLITFSTQGATCLGCSETVGLDFNAAPELAFMIAVRTADYLGDVWNWGCVEFELASLAIAGINAAGAGKLA
jgi:hypothetical protein